MNLINQPIDKDFVKPQERLRNLGLRPIWFIKGYESYFRDLNNKKMLVKKNIFKVN